jgi:hypothetical protein
MANKMNEAARRQVTALQAKLEADHAADALRYSLAQMEASHQALAGGPPRGLYKNPPPATIGLSDFGTADLVMEMLSRGYAVIKMPESGELPDVLKP